ncbi:MAG: hypothetical protein HY341_02165 [Candidatus Kerfeldbacteria bacterium]|nr:hypothetical protein [Candidatus Kerfeldbacteria bacterium]
MSTMPRTRRAFVQRTLFLLFRVFVLTFLGLVMLDVAVPRFVSRQINPLIALIVAVGIAVIFAVFYYRRDGIDDLIEEQWNTMARFLRVVTLVSVLALLLTILRNAGAASPLVIAILAVYALLFCIGIAFIRLGTRGE